jgi:hypothetical protein
MIITDIKNMKNRCSTKGWGLFVKHRINLGEESPENWDNEAEIGLSKIEAIQYEYN